MNVAIEHCHEGVIVPVRVRAGARRTGVAGHHDGALRIDVSAAPEKGKANRGVAAVLAEVFQVPKSSITLSAGATSSQKRFLIRGLSVDAARILVETALADG